jgi:hypothetical protein
MVSYRPLGVTILAVIIILTYSVIFIVGLLVLIWGITTIPYIGAGGVAISLVGVVFLVWAFLRLSMGFGLLSLRRKAWRSAMLVFCIGLVIDIFISRGQGQVLMDVIVIIYLLIVKRHFRYGD